MLVTNINNKRRRTYCNVKTKQKSKNRKQLNVENFRMPKLILKWLINFYTNMHF